MRIGFVAMSGVRACDPELLKMGLTLPGFVERGKTIAALPSLGARVRLPVEEVTPAVDRCLVRPQDQARGDVPAAAGTGKVPPGVGRVASVDAD